MVWKYHDAICTTNRCLVKLAWKYKKGDKVEVKDVELFASNVYTNGRVSGFNDGLGGRALGKERVGEW